MKIENSGWQTYFSISALKDSAVKNLQRENWSRNFQSKAKES